MRTNLFGNTGLTVSRLGFGAGHIGSPDKDGSDVEKLLNAVLDAGVTLVDTARGYGLSEERIGRYLSPRRAEYILSTKVGYSVPGYQDWTHDCVTSGIELALHTLKTEYIDIVHLHSCPLHVLQNNGVTDALNKAKDEGKIVCAAYSGENEELAYAATSGLFGSVQTSVNVFDQFSRNNILPAAKEAGIGIIAKRPLGNCPWKFDERPFGAYAEEYWHRMKTMDMDFAENWLETAVRFAAWHGNADTIITGSQSIEHIQQIITFVNNGPLEETIVSLITERFGKHGGHWRGEI